MQNYGITQSKNKKAKHLFSLIMISLNLHVLSIISPLEKFLNKLSVLQCVTLLFRGQKETKSCCIKPPLYIFVTEKWLVFYK